MFYNLRHLQHVICKVTDIWSHQINAAHFNTYEVKLKSAFKHQKAPTEQQQTLQKNQIQKLYITAESQNEELECEAAHISFLLVGSAVFSECRKAFFGASPID